MAKKALEELTADMENIHIEEVEIITNPLRALRDGIKFIPTIKVGDQTLSGILLSSEKIEKFLNKAEQQ